MKSIEYTGRISLALGLMLAPSALAQTQDPAKIKACEFSQKTCIDSTSHNYQMCAVIPHKISGCIESRDKSLRACETAFLNCRGLNKPNPYSPPHSAKPRPSISTNPPTPTPPSAPSKSRPCKNRFDTNCAWAAPVITREKRVTFDNQSEDVVYFSIRYRDDDQSWGNSYWYAIDPNRFGSLKFQTNNRVVYVAVTGDNPELCIHEIREGEQVLRTAAGVDGEQYQFPFHRMIESPSNSYRVRVDECTPGNLRRVPGSPGARTEQTPRKMEH